MQSTPTPSPVRPPHSRRDILTGLGLAAATPLVLGITHRPERPPVPVGPTILLRGASLVLTMDPALGSGPLGALDNADVLMRGGTIAAVGTSLRPPPGTRIVDASGKLVMPGFVDTHTHLWQALIRGGCTDGDLFGWFTRCTDPQRGRLTPKPCTASYASPPSTPSSRG